jgi:hypothetical protein
MKKEAAILLFKNRILNNYWIILYSQNAIQNLSYSQGGLCDNLIGLNKI